jgi:hypothetical protein
MSVGIDWMQVAHDTIQLRAIVNIVLNFWVLYNVEEFLSS